MYENQLSESQLKTLQEITGKKTRVKKADFSFKLEEFVHQEKVEYITALLHLCELYDVDFENINKYLTEPIKQKIADENGLLQSVYGINSALPV